MYEPQQQSILLTAILTELRVFCTIAESGEADVSVLSSYGLSEPLTKYRNNFSIICENERLQSRISSFRNLATLVYEQESYRRRTSAT